MFGLALHPTTQAFYVTENSGDSHDELNVIRAGANYGFYKNADVDKAYLAGRAEPDQAKRAQDYQDAYKLLSQDVPWAFMWVTTRYGAVSKKAQNFLYTPSAGSGRYYDQAELWTVGK